MKIPGRIGALVQQGLRTLRPATNRSSETPPRVRAADAAAGDSRTASDLSLREVLAEDFAAYGRDPSEPGLWAVVAHRLGTHGTKTDSLVTNVVLGTAHRVMATSVDLLWGIELPREVQLGRRVRLWHSGCMRLHAKTIGNDVQIRHDTTLGPLRARDGEAGQLPVIEDRAQLGSGVCVLGNVRVGHDAMIGANSLVIKNVPPEATVMGVPARILPS